MAVTPADVRAIYPNGAVLDDTQIQDMIDFVDSILAELLADCDYSTTMLDAITRYMVAHYLAVGMEQGGIIRKRTGDSEERYRELSDTAQGLGMTVYGQQALALDLQGCLSPLNTTTLKAQFRVV